MTVAQFSPWNDDNPRQIKRRIITTGFSTFGFGFFSLTVPGHVLWRPVLFAFTLTTDATVANRVVRLSYSMEGGNSFFVETPTLITASKTWVTTFVVGPFPTNASDKGTSTGMPDLIIQGGEQLQVQVDNVGAADAVSQQRLLVDEVFEEPGAPPAERVSVVDRLDSIEESIHRLR